MSPSPVVCPRHPDAETRLRCSSCESPICPDCWRDAAVGYHCPDCATAREQAAAAAADRIGRASGVRQAMSTTDRLPAVLALRTGTVGLAASAIGGLLLGPVLVAGSFFLLSAGVMGWLVARAVVWAAQERATALVRAVALTLAGFTVAIGFATAGGVVVGSGLAALAYPAALWGGWMVVRQR